MMTVEKCLETPERFSYSTQCLQDSEHCIALNIRVKKKHERNDDNGHSSNKKNTPETSDRISHAI